MPGQGSNQIPCVLKKVRTQSATCGLALSCWKLAISRPWRYATTTGHKMSEMYWSAFKLLSIQTRDVHAMYPTAVQTITPGAGSLCQYWIQAGNEQSLQSPDMYTVIRILLAKMGLVWKDDIMSLLYPALSFGTPWPSLYAALSRGAEVMVTVLTVHAAANGVIPYKRILACWKHGHFLTNGPWCGCTILQARPHNMSVLSAISHWRALRSCMPFSMTSVTHWFKLSHDSS